MTKVAKEEFWSVGRRKEASARVKERKKYGQPGARRRFQFSKR